MKKITALLLTVTLIITSMSYVFAADAKEFFKSAYKATSLEFKTEMALMKAIDPSESILNELVKNTYQTKMSLGMDNSRVEGTSLKGLSMDYVQLANDASKKILGTYSINVPKDLSPTDDALIFNLKALLENDNLTVQSPEISDIYYSANLKDLTKWNSSPIGELLPLTSDNIALIKYYLTSMFNQVEMSNKILKYAEKLPDTYVSLFNTYLDKAAFKFDGNGFVEIGNLKYNFKKTTVTFSAELVNGFLADLSESIKTDSNLRGLLDVMYKNTPTLGLDITDYVITSISDLLAGISVDKPLVYTIYTNSKNQIVRHNISFDIDDTTTAKLTFDTKGSKYLLDNIMVDASVTNKDSNETYAANLSFKGSNVPVDGVMDVAGTANVTYKTDDVKTELGNCTFTSYWNSNKKLDNFSFDAKVNSNSQQLASLFMKGDYVADEASNTIYMNLHNFNVTAPDTILAMHILVEYKPAVDAKFSLPTDKVKKLIDLTAQEASDLLTKVTGLIASE